MTLLEQTRRRRPASRSLIALLTAALCGAGIAAYYVGSSSELRSIDAAMLAVMVLFLAYGTAETVLRGVTTALSLYLSTAVAGLFYAVLMPYSRSLLEALGALGLRTPPAARPDTPALAVSFALAAATIWLILELLFRAALPEAHIAWLGFVDRVGGAALYLAVGVVVAALSFKITSLGLVVQSACAEAALRPFLERVIDLLAHIQSLWFTGPVPVVYAHGCLWLGFS